MQGKNPPRREREKLRKRGEILSVALELFSKRGYHNVPLHEIAERAEFAIGTIYKFFPNKEALYKALVLEQSEKFHKALEEAVEKPENLFEKLRNYVKVKGEVFRANASMIRLYFAETRGASFNIMAGLDSEIREKYKGFLKKIAGIFETGMKRKLFKEIAVPYHLAVALDSVTNSFLFLSLEEPERNPYPEDPDVILDILFKGLVA